MQLISFLIALVHMILTFIWGSMFVGWEVGLIMMFIPLAAWIFLSMYISSYNWTKKKR